MKRHIVCVTIVLFLSMTSAVGMAQQEISWECFEIFSDRTTPIIKVLVIDNIGMIETNGISKIAMYTQQGLTHRWDFDLNESDGTYDASFGIDPEWHRNILLLRR